MAAASESPRRAAAKGPFWARHIEGIVYVLAGATYIPIAIEQKFLLDWIVGPAWLLAFIWILLPPLKRVADRALGPTARDGGQAGTAP
jgi:hypothetical protein